MENLQPLIDELINSESGAEIIMDGDEEMGAIAELVYSPQSKQVAFKLLGPWATMGYDRVYGFLLKDSVFQKDKNRLVMRSTGSHIYVLQPAQTDSATSTLAHFELSKEKRNLIREGLIAYIGDPQ